MTLYYMIAVVLWSFTMFGFWGSGSYLNLSIKTIFLIFAVVGLLILTKVI